MLKIIKKTIRVVISENLINTCWHLPRAFFAACINGFPARNLTCIAVAGTKGKTSTSYFLSQFLDAAHIPNALLCTAAIKLPGDEKLNALKMTTPDVFYIQQFFKKSIQAHCTHAILEVSSHAIAQHRIFGIPFSIVVLPTLMPDHLEYHATAKDYQDIHKKLITPNLKTLVLNADDTNLALFQKLIPSKTKTVSLTDEISKTIQSARKDIQGNFMISNIRCAFEAALACGIELSLCNQTLQTLQSAPGRWEYINQQQNFSVIVDYAHSPDSLQNFLSAVKQTCTEKLIIVFGACGDRDKHQREPMGIILDRYADTIIITTDDSYSEEPEAIAKQLAKGIRNKTSDSFFTILDRKEAIRKAISLANKDDVVCILGKGAEQWQILQDKKIPWDDRKIVRELLVIHEQS